ncbi:MAG: hypothetical protein BAA04_02335 [Firmicutes bacterium ZCTH02-B6]|nr:MAG: hypothetical protein BAA04_02335 [Firmicutes bacterium ZCTH02-B6]
MGMPTIPQEPYRPTRAEVIIDLLKSIAMEETALAHLMDAEAYKVRAFVGRYQNFPLQPSMPQVLAFTAQVFKLIDVIAMKEWLLLRKLREVAHLACVCEGDDGYHWREE